MSASTHPSSPLTRRTFLATGAAALSAASSGLAARFEQFPLHAPASASTDLTEIDPGFVGPQFFDQNERQALLEVLESGSPFRYWGPGKPDKVQAFEDAFAKYMGARFALGVTSGTAALDCAMAALEIGPGDEVIVPAYTWWSDYTCVVHAGALPVFANIDRTLNIDPKDLEQKISPRTKAVIAVHLLGGPCAMEPILAIAQRAKIAVVEDCAQCVGGSYQGKKLGSLADIGIYSFQINKMITSGEGGALVTNNPTLYERAARFHDMGTIRPPFSERIGTPQLPTFAGENFRMSELTGALLGAQLPKLDRMVQQLQFNANSIRADIQSLPGLRLRQQPDPAGDIGYGVFWEMQDKNARDQSIRQLKALHLPASTLTGSILLPTAESVVQKRTRHPLWPSFNTTQGKTIAYGPDSCRPTLDLYDRFIQIRVGAKYTARINAYIVDCIRQVYRNTARVS